MRESDVDCVCISLPNQISICVDLQTVNRFCVFCVRKSIPNTTAELSASSTVFEGYFYGNWRLIYPAAYMFGQIMESEEYGGSWRQAFQWRLHQLPLLITLRWRGLELRPQRTIWSVQALPMLFFVFEPDLPLIIMSMKWWMLGCALVAKNGKNIYSTVCTDMRSF